MELSPRVVDAFARMYDLHKSQRRKGSGTPYLAHLMSAAALVAEHGGDEDQFIAALLHDAVEDCGGLETLARVREEFGPRVAGIVELCSDSHTPPKPPWRARKEQHLAKLAKADPEVKLVVAADKLHNARSILSDRRVHGEAIWDRFTGRKEGSLWYYRSMLHSLQQQWSHPILHDLEEVVRALGAFEAAE